MTIIRGLSKSCYLDICDRFNYTIGVASPTIEAFDSSTNVDVTLDIGVVLTAANNKIVLTFGIERIELEKYKYVKIEIV